jgi:hypothetical protein
MGNILSLRICLTHLCYVVALEDSLWIGSRISIDIHILSSSRVCHWLVKRIYNIEKVFFKFSSENLKKSLDYNVPPWSRLFRLRILG